jgi:hypothetical protein
MDPEGEAAVAVVLAAARIDPRKASRGPEEASHWLNEQPPGPSRDAGMAKPAEHAAPTDPAAAAAWADTMTPGPRRDEALERALDAWMRKDRSAATEWLNHQRE